MDYAKPPQADILESISGTAPELLDCLLLIRYLALGRSAAPGRSAPVARDRNGSTEDGQPRGGASGGSSLLPAG